MKTMTFINGENRDCGCKAYYSTGGGQYSDVITIQFCPLHDIEKAVMFLHRALPIIQADAQMAADITRFAPLDPTSQAIHDSTETESEKLMQELPAFLKQYASRKQIS